MSGRLNLTPLDVAAVTTPPSAASGGYAALTKGRVVQLARAMPDCQSAILLLLAWQATRNEKMKFGRLAGRSAASLSGAQLAEMTGRPLRTVRHALCRLSASRVILKETASAGKKNTYALAFMSERSTPD